MVSYFMTMWNLLSAIKREEKNIDGILIYNTHSCSTQFKNIEISVNYNLHSIIYFYDKDKSKYIELRNEEDRLRRIFNEDKYRVDCETWVSMYNKIISICEDIHEVLKEWEINIPISIDLCDHKGCYNGEKFFEYELSVLPLLRELDCKELMKTTEFDKLATSKIGEIKKQIDFINWNFQRLEKQLRSQKKAYIISKLVDGKTDREEYEQYPELIEAFDAFVDIKKAINKKPYR